MNGASIGATLEQSTLEKNLSGARSREARSPAAGRVGVCGEPTHRQHGFHERRSVRRRIPVAIPAAVGPLPVQQAFHEFFRAFISEAQTGEEEKCIALLRRATPVPALHDWHALLLISLGFAGGFKFLVEKVIEPGF